MKKLLILIGMFFYVNSFSQTNDIITLEFCHKEAIKNYPLNKQKELFDSSNELKIQNLNKNYLPQLNLNAQATYQSDVTFVTIDFSDITIDMPVPGPAPEITGQPETPVMPKDQYKATLDLNQMIYDGGAVKNQKEVESFNLLINKKNIDIELYKLKENINEIFFKLFLLQENKKLINVAKDEVNAHLQKIESGIKNGVILESNADVLKAELIMLDQKLLEVEVGITMGFKILNEFCNTNISESSNFVLPTPEINVYTYSNNRPEVGFLELQQEKIDATKKLISSKGMPKMFGFGQLGYGKPGLDMFSENFDSFYLVGAKLSWNIWNWNQNKTDKQILDLQNKIISSQKETFDKNIKIACEKDISEINKFELLIQKDREIIELKTKIKETASSQLTNGVITSSDYLTELNAETQAKLNLETHKIQLIKAKVNYLTTIGKF